MCAYCTDIIAANVPACCCSRYFFRYTAFQAYADVAYRLGLIHYAEPTPIPGIIAEHAATVAAPPVAAVDDAEAKMESSNFEALLLGVVRFLWDATPETLMRHNK